MSEPIKNLISLQSESIPAALGKTSLTSNIFRQGNRIAFRVLNALPSNQYLIEVNQQQFQVNSRLPLQVGNSYVAEVAFNQGQIQLQCKSLVNSLIEGLLSQKHILSGTFSSFLEKLNTVLPSQPSFFSGCQTAEAVRSALLNCGMFYEARLLEAFRKGKPSFFSQDFKHFLLKQLSDPKSLRIQDPINALLKNLEVRQLTGLDSGLNGPVFFWLPFMGSTFIEGFIQRRLESQEPRFVVTLRLPFIEQEELIVTLLWQPSRLEIYFAAGPLTEPILIKATAQLKERFKKLGINGTVIKVSRHLPLHVKKELKGIRFVESYG